VVKLISVHYQKTPTVSQQMMKLFIDSDSGVLAEQRLDDRGAKEVVVVSHGKMDAGSVSRQLQQSLNDETAFWLPMPAFPDTPAIDEVTDDIKPFRLIGSQQLQKRLNLRMSKAEVQITDKEASNGKVAFHVTSIRHIHVALSP
jgi:hypothetical protein